MVDSPWEDAVSIREMTEADFERRNDGITVSSRDGRLSPILDALCDHYGMDESPMMDRCLRLYLAHRFDHTDHDYRDEFGVRSLVPPAGWVGENTERFPSLDYGDPLGEPYQVSVSTPPTVKEMVEAVLDRGDTPETGLGAFVIAACEWVADGCP